MLPSEFQSQLKGLVHAHTMALAKFARARVTFREMSSTTHPDWLKVGESLVVLGGICDELITSSAKIDELREQFTGQPKINGKDPLPVAPPEIDHG